MPSLRWRAPALLFSADHVMGWSTSIVAPPDGAMADYMASLDKLLARRDRFSCPAMAARSRTRTNSCAGSRRTARCASARSWNGCRPATARSPRWWRRSTATPTRGCTARPRFRCWRIWRTWSPAASWRPTAIRRSMRTTRPRRRTLSGSPSVAPQSGGASDCAGGSVGTGTSEAGSVGSAERERLRLQPLRRAPSRKPAMRAALSPRSWRP